MPRVRMIARYLLLLPMGVLVACTVGPDFQKPELELPKSFSHQGVSWKRQILGDLPKSGAWWEVFGDRELDRLVEQALKQNQELAAAAARLDQARALSKVARSDYFPSVDLGLGARRTKSLFRGPAGGAIYYNSFTVPVDFSYELALWGKVRRKVEGAKAREAATEESLRAMQLSVAGEVAQTYWALRAVDADRLLMQRSLEVRRKALELMRKQQNAGIISGLELSQAESEVATADAARIGLDQQRVELVNALAVLTGRMATGMGIAMNPNLPSTPQVPAGVPSQVMLQRPDVRMALHLVAAANADVGVASAAMYPSFTIGASSGLDTQALGDLFKSDSLVWSLGSNALLPLTGQKFLRNQREAAQAAHRAASADYRQVVIESVREVETALQGAAIIQQQRQAQAQAVEASRKTYQHSLKRFEAGTISFLEVVDAERQLLNSERNANAVQAEALAVSVSLIKAIGGQW